MVIEAMIAALIISAMAAVLLETIAANAAAAHRLAERRQAMLVAQSALSATGMSGPVSPGAREGTDGGLAWRIAIAPYAGGVGSAGLLEQVTVTVRDARAGGPPLVTLASLRFGR